MWKTVKHLLLKLHERKLGSVTHVKVTHLNFFTPIHLSDSFCVASLMFYIETSFFLECNDHWVFFNSLFNFNEWLLIVPQFLSVCNSFTWIHICNVQFRININKENPRIVFFNIRTWNFNLYSAGKCSILQVTCFPLG